MPFSVPRRKKSWWCEEGEEGEGEEKVHLLTHATARGMGKKHKSITNLRS